MDYFLRKSMGNQWIWPFELFQWFFLFDFTLFVIDIHQIMLISLFSSTPFDHFHSHPTLGLDPALILTLRHSSFRSWCTMVFKTHVKNSVTLKIVYSSPLRSWIIQDCCRRKLVFLDQFFGKNNLFPHVDPMNTLWTPPQSVIHCWKATHLLFVMVKRRKKIHPVMRQIFDDAPGQTFYMTWDCVV